jgi:hypothetical protein
LTRRTKKDAPQQTTKSAATKRISRSESGAAISARRLLKSTRHDLEKTSRGLDPGGSRSAEKASR